jgi:hypothetical protein
MRRWLRMPDKKVYINPEKKVFIIDGKTYKVEKETLKKKSDHASKEILVEVNMDDYNDRINKIIDYIASTFNERKFLASLLEGLPLSEIAKIERRMAKMEKVREKDGCYNLMIGDFELPINE